MFGLQVIHRPPSSLLLSRKSLLQLSDFASSLCLLTRTQPRILVLKFPEQLQHPRLDNIRCLKMRQGGFLSFDDLAKNLYARDSNHG